MQLWSFTALKGCIALYSGVEQIAPVKFINLLDS